MPRRKKPALTLSEVTIPQDYDIRRDGISQSLLSIFPLCRLKFLLKINRWQKPGSDVTVTFGNICHDVLEYGYKRKKFPGPKVINRLIEEACERIEQYASSYALELLAIEASKAQVVMEEYFKYYRNDFKKMKFEQLEKVFEVKFFGFKLKGKKDGLFTDPLRKLFEHKTKGQIKEDLLNCVLNFDFQNLFYITSEEAETKKKLNRVCYNIIRNPNLKQRKNESVKQYIERIREDIKSRPEWYFVRYNVSYTEKDKKIFRGELIYKLTEVEKFLKGKLPLYRNQMACEIPYRCEFLEACGSGNLMGYVQGKTLFPELE